ncbi:MAG: lytic transglycosylase domain-containing protein, partial [Pseudomonadota bacterium]
HGGVPPYAETRAYVPRVLSAFVVASKLCRQPPRSPRRRCSLPSFRE